MQATVATYTELESVFDSNGIETILPLKKLARAQIPSERSVDLIFPNRSAISGEVTFDIRSPDGELLTRKEVASLPEDVVLEVSFADFAKTLPNLDPSFAKPKRFRGRVIDREGETSKLAGRQVVIWASEKEEPEAADFRALIVVRTDDSGYFSGPYPVGKFTASYGEVASKNNEPQSVPLHLKEDGTFPDSVILVTDLDEDDFGTEDDCECAKVGTPRDPDQADLPRGDGIFTSDAGGGQCVDFAKPDRTI